MKSLKISVVIPTWNGKKWLKVCLPSLREQTFKDFEVIVVDNGSNDGSNEYVKKYFPEYRLVELAKNFGFAGGVNRGIEASVGENIVLINNDMKTDKDFLKQLYLSLQDKKVGLVAAKVLQYYHPSLIDSAGDYIDIVGHANNIGQGDDSEKYNKSIDIFLVTGGACLIRREVLAKVGLFDEDYFAYFEDVDLCLRAQYCGFKAAFQPKAIVHHVHKATSSRNRALLEYWQFRNMTMNVIKDFPNCVIWYKWNWLKIILVNIHTVYFLSRQGWLLSALKAEGYIFIHIFKLLQKRGQIQSLISVDEAYLRSIFREKKIKIPLTSWRF